MIHWNALYCVEICHAHSSQTSAGAIAAVQRLGAATGSVPLQQQAASSAPRRYSLPSTGSAGGQPQTSPSSSSPDAEPASSSTESSRNDGGSGRGFDGGSSGGSGQGDAQSYEAEAEEIADRARDQARKGRATTAVATAPAMASQIGLPPLLQDATPISRGPRAAAPADSGGSGSDESNAQDLMGDERELRFRTESTDRGSVHRRVGYANPASPPSEAGQSDTPLLGSVPPKAIRPSPGAASAAGSDSSSNPAASRLLLASFQHQAARGAERVKRLSRIVTAMATAATEGGSISAASGGQAKDTRKQVRDKSSSLEEISMFIH